MSDIFKRFRQEDADAMKEVERALVQLLLPFRARMPPAVVALALVRCARVVLRLADREDQDALLPVLVHYLQGRINPPGAGSILLTDTPTDEVH